MTSLSERQRQALQERPRSPLFVIDSVTHASYVVLPSHAFDRVRALFEEDEFHAEELATLVNEVAAKEGWADPVMDGYDAKGSIG